MDPTPSQVMKVKAQAIKRTLEKASDKAKTSHVTNPLAAQFNELVEDIGKHYPAIRSGLPKKIESTTDFSIMGMSDVSYLDLEIFCEQVINLLELVESGS